MSISKVNLDRIARRIRKPFETGRLGLYGGLELSIFICQGTFPWHRHIDEDELFLVYEGAIQMVTERGELTLRAEEMVIVPKGVAHSTSSPLRSVVLLLRPYGATGSSNGRRRLFATDEDEQLEKIKLGSIYHRLESSYVPVEVASMEGHSLMLWRCAGIGPEWPPPSHNIPLLVVRGTVEIETDEERIVASGGDLVTVEAYTPYRISTVAQAMVFSLEREHESL